MNLSYSLILAFVGIAGPTSAGPASAGPASDEPTSIYLPFENDFNTVYNEVNKYCDDPAKYDKSSSGDKSGYGPIKDWDVSALTTMSGLFREGSGCRSCITCNPPVSNWNVSAVEDFSYMFNGAAAFNQDLSGWDVRKGYSFILMFQGSGMKHYIGDWLICIKGIGDFCESQLSVISLMLEISSSNTWYKASWEISSSASWYKTLPLAEKQQFINLITPKKYIEG